LALGAPNTTRLKALKNSPRSVRVAGLKQMGTEAAGHVLSDAREIGALARQPPAGWESRNMQIVLHTKVIGAGPSAPESVAYYLW